MSDDFEQVTDDLIAAEVAKLEAAEPPKMEEGIDPPEVKDDAPAEPPAEPVKAEPRADTAEEAEARKYGWLPEEELPFKPKEGGFIPADRFLNSSKVRMAKMEEKHAAEIDAVRNESKRAAQIALDMQKAKYEADVEALEAKKIEAVQSADMDAYKEAAEAQSKLTPPAAEEPVDTFEADFAAERGKWAWGGDDYLMGRASELLSSNAAAANMSLPERFSWANEQLQRYYPHLVKKPEPARRPAAVAPDPGGSGDFDAPAKGYADLPAEAKFMCNELGVDKEQYAKTYWESV